MFDFCTPFVQDLLELARCMGASIVLLSEQDSFSCVFTPYSVIFICLRHMIIKIAEN